MNPVAHTDPVAVTPDGSITAIGTPAAANDLAYPPASRAWYCVVIIALSLMINFLDRGIIAMLIPSIEADLHLSDSQMGLITGFAFTLFYAICGLPVARLIDRSTRKFVLGAGLMIFAVVTLFTGFARSFGQLFATRVAMGVGESTSGPGAYSLLSDYFPPRLLPRAFTAMQVGFVVGSSSASIVGAGAIAYATAHPGLGIAALAGFKTWQLTMMLVSIPGFVVALLMLTVREPPRRGGTTQQTAVGDVFKLAWRHRGVYLALFLGMGLRSAQMFGTQGWSTTYFVRHFHWTPVQYGVIWFPISLGAMSIGLLLGWLMTEYFQHRGRADGCLRTVLISTSISVPLGLLAPLSPTPLIALIMFGLANATAIMPAASENAAIQSVTPNRMRGQMTFLFLFMMNVVGMGIGPSIVPFFNDFVFGEQKIAISMVAMGLLCGLPAILAFWIGLRPYGRAYAAGGVENVE